MVDKLKTKAKSAKELEKEQKRQNKLNSLKNEFEGGKIKDFGQVFAIFNQSPLAKELDIPFYTFKQKIADPGEFTINELIRFAQLINVDDQLIVKFIFEHKKNLSKKTKKG